MHLEKPTGKASFPTKCNRWTCRRCHRAKRYKLDHSLIIGCLAEYEDRQFGMGSLTFRAPLQSSISWQHFLKQRGIDDSFVRLLPPPPTLEEMPSHRQFSVWMAKVFEGFPYDRVAYIMRWFDEALWRRYITGCWSRLCKFYNARFRPENEFVALRVIEMTKQLWPHLHFSFLLPLFNGKRDDYGLEVWFKTVWAYILGDESEHVIRAGFVMRRKNLNNTLTGSLRYSTKYITKGMASKMGREWKGPRYSMTQNFPRAESVDLGTIVVKDKLIDPESLERYGVLRNRKEARAVRARLRYWIDHPVVRDAVTVAYATDASVLPHPDELATLKPEWIPTNQKDIDGNIVWARTGRLIPSSYWSKILQVAHEYGEFYRHQQRRTTMTSRYEWDGHNDHWQVPEDFHETVFQYKHQIFDHRGIEYWENDLWWIASWIEPGLSYVYANPSVFDT